jgi:hypothetical protein
MEDKKIEKPVAYILPEDVRQAIIQFLAQPCPHVSGMGFLNLWNALQTLAKIDVPEPKEVVAGKSK